MGNQIRQKSAPRPRNKARNPFAVWVDGLVGITYDVLAKELKCSKQAIANLRAGRYKPGRELANRIELVSLGRITAASWDAPKKRTRRAA